MKIKILQLQNYRNYKEETFNFDPEVTLIIGPNGSGKTNVIEAVNMVATGKPFRTGYDREIIRHEEQIATIRAKVTGRGTQTKKAEEHKTHRIGIALQKSEKYANTSGKKVKIDGKSKRISALSEYFNTVLFSPLDMDLLTGSPSGRRIFLDNILSQSSKEYREALSDFTKARRQRNKVLELIRETGGGQVQIKYWNERFLSLGQKIHEERKALIGYLNEELGTKLTKADKELRAQTRYEDSPLTKARLEEYYPKEVAAGTSLIGPHREDFALMDGGLDLANYSSRGQQRTLILVLKLCELEFLESKLGHKPVLLLDDIFSELDEEHRKTLKNLVHSQQTILTATDIPKGFETSPRIILP